MATNFKYKSQAERLIKTLEIVGKRGLNVLGLSTASDSLKFANAPEMKVTENLDEAYIDSGGTEYSIAEFNFTSLQESMGRMSRILIYYEKADLDTFSEPEKLDIKSIQGKELLADIPVLFVDDDLTFKRSIKINEKPVSYYNFYAIYLDSTGDPSTFDGKVVINYQYLTPFYGININNSIISVPDLRWNEVQEGIDRDGYGYIPAQKTKKNEIEISWFDPRDITSYEQWQYHFSDFDFRDTFGNKINLQYQHKDKIQYFVLYMFISKNRKSPISLAPMHVDWQFSKDPGVKDPNGKWEFVDKFSNSKAKVILPPNSVVGFWIGMKLEL